MTNHHHSWKRHSSSKGNSSLKVGQTPKTAVWKKNKATLWYYQAAEKKYHTPLFLVYSLINQPYILDLAPGSSMIEAFIKNGFDVYLLDFGIPGYEDKDLSLDDYIVRYIQKGVQRALRHSKAKEISLIGYCLGGTFATIYTAIANEPIKNLILTVTPIDFDHPRMLDKWHQALKKRNLDLDELIDAYGIIPAKMVKAGMRLAASPLSFAPYLALLQRLDDDQYVEKWRRFNMWANDHIPLSGATLKQLVNDLVKDNKLIKNKLMIDQQQVILSNIHANLLVVSASLDQIVTKEMAQSIMDVVSSGDKQFLQVEGGHANLAKKGDLPAFLKEWLPQRSNPIS